MRLNRKNKILLFGFFIALYICYAFAISNTITFYQEYQSKNELIASNSDFPKWEHQLLLKEKQLDLALAQYSISDTESFQNKLLKQLNIYGNTYHLKIIDFKEPLIISEKGLTSASYIFSLKGSFTGCLSLLNKIENNPSFGSIKHLNFAKKRDYKTNTDYLIVEVIIQQNRNL
jgi:hypothetical protein